MKREQALELFLHAASFGQRRQRKDQRSKLRRGAVCFLRTLLQLQRLLNLQPATEPSGCAGLSDESMGKFLGLTFFPLYYLLCFLKQGASPCWISLQTVVCLRKFPGKAPGTNDFESAFCVL